MEKSRLPPNHPEKHFKKLLQLARNEDCESYSQSYHAKRKFCNIYIAFCSFCCFYLQQNVFDFITSNSQSETWSFRENDGKVF